MKADWIPSQRLTLAGLLGAVLLIAGPAAARADQGKWWTPGRPHVAAPRYHPPRGGFIAAGPRYWRPYAGYRIYRDFVTVGRGYYAPRYWAPGTRVWRYYAYPTYYAPTRTCYVRPVRFYVSAGAVIGGVAFSAGYANPGYYYGCNFCGAQFGAYGAYHAHVVACPARPQGYRVVAQNWDGDWQGGQWQDQGHRSCEDDQGGYDEEYDE